MTLPELVERAIRTNRSLTFGYSGYARVVVPHRVEGGLLWAECLSDCHVKSFCVDQIERPRLGWRADELQVPVPKLELIHKVERD